ncbi:MAG: flagellar motor switch protein FliN [Deltaproteobacteria bacterium]|nr:flagellar motor switch protein FliN [Deltaproteobacteria bacterium]
MPGAEQVAANKVAHPDGRPGRSIDFLMDIPLELTVEIGRRSMTMGELIELTPGTVVELDHGSEENLDIVVNGKLVARGEAVMVGERYGVRVMEIIGEDPFK